MFLRSERLFLRPGWPEDRTELLALVDDGQLASDRALAVGPDRADDAPARAGSPASRFPQFCVTLPATPGARLIGTIGLVQDGGDARLECWIARAFRNRGYATEAVRALGALAATLGHGRIVARSTTGEPAFARMLVKAGFRAMVEMRAAAGPVLLYALDLARPGNCDMADPGPLPRVA